MLFFCFVFCFCFCADWSTFFLFVSQRTFNFQPLVTITCFFLFLFFTDYTVIVSVNITGGTISHRRVHFLFESFSTNMLIHTSEDLAGGSDNIVCS